MGIKRPNSGESMWRCAGVGAVIAIILTILLAGVVGLLEKNEAVSEGVADKMCYVVQAVSIMIGCLLSPGKGRGAVAPVTALVYCALLAGVTFVFFGGVFGRVILSMMMIAAGVGFALIIMKLGSKSKGNRFKRKVYSR